MRPIDQCSGKWVGWSIQFGEKIHEDIELKISGGTIAGAGCDKDGDFVVDGYYDRRQTVTLTRRYTYCIQGPEGLGIPYVYRGTWNGDHVHGSWSPRSMFIRDGGTFEMWPNNGEEEEEFEMREEELEQVGVGS